MTTVYFNGGRVEAARIVRALVGTLIGRNQRFPDYARGVFLALGFAALSDIHEDFIRKARGGTGEDGVRWPKLSAKYLAYGRRFGPGEKTALKKDAGLTRANSYAPGGKSGMLTKAELKRWRGIYAALLAKLAVHMPIGEAKAKAAAIAWNKLKAAGATTKLEVFGHREVEILRDTSVLLNSLSMGRLSGNDYTKPNVEGGEEQIFEPLDNGIIVGTRVKYARAHNEGIPGRLPERRFIPKADQVPPQWLARWLNVGMTAVSFALQESLNERAT